MAQGQQNWSPQHSGGGQQQPNYAQPTQQETYEEEEESGGYSFSSALNHWNTLDKGEKIKMLIAFILGCLACGLIFMALCEDKAATSDYIFCGWTRVYGIGLWNTWDPYPYADACKTEGAACAALAGGVISILCLLFAFFISLVAIIWVNPFIVCPTKFGTGPYKTMFIITLVLVIIALIAWLALGSGYCMGPEIIRRADNSIENLGAGIGASIVLEIFAIILLIIVILLSCMLKK
eukprot:214688_1